MTKSANLTDSLELAPSELYVGDLQKMTSFYRNAVGLSTLEVAKGSVTLGHDEVSVVKLVEKPKLAFASPRNAGLFHNAILFDSRGDLAQAAGNVITKHPRSFTGTGDHLVSEAFYFDDPEGNGLELYFDRPSDTWTWSDGLVEMDTLYIDPIQYINGNASDATGGEKKLGHVHMKVGNVDQAKKFYVEALGFDVTAMVPGAVFVSIGGYHHHLALNTWLSQGAQKRPETLGLSEVTITLTAQADLDRLALRLEKFKYDFVYNNEHIAVSDPWGNILLFKAGSSE